MEKGKILITGASGQLGNVLTKKLSEVYGRDRILATDIKQPDEDPGVPFAMMDIMNIHRLYEIVDENNVQQIYHLAAILSANGEWNPQKTWEINMDGLLSVLELSRTHHIEKLFFPSSIAVFGDTTPKLNTPQDTPLLPTTVYGISKITGELWCNYYHQRYGLDVRSVRFPGIIGYQSLPGGGTTDYAVEIFHEALKNGSYTCFLGEDSRLPMLYMDDAVRAIIEIMDAPAENIRTRYSYNLAGIDFTPGELAAEIKKHIKGFTIDYKPDFRQAIADSWSDSIDDHQAREDWNWKPKYDIGAIVADMILNLEAMHQYS